jgi:MSHA biogenesis protein MshL
MKRTLGMLVLAMLAACAAPGTKNSTAKAIRAEMNTAAQESAQVNKAQAAVDNALLPPIEALPKGKAKPSEVRFDLTVNNTPAKQVFMAIVSGTRYSMLVHPDVTGDISLNLKNVTVFDALEAIRDLYGYEYKVDGTRIYIKPISLQTRIYHVNYLTGIRKGKSSLRVTSGSVSDSPHMNTGTTGTTNTTTTSNTSQQTVDSSKVTTSTDTDFWDELSKAIHTIVGNEKGRSVVISPMSGVIVIRAMPDELRNVAAYLRASQISVERQVILEAKIIEVQLSSGFQSGVNWGAFKSSPNSLSSLGQLGSSTTLQPSLRGGTAQALSNPLLTATPGSNLVSSAATVATNPITGLTGTAGSMFGLAFQTSSFAALLNFLETQGDVHVLSSPRIATLNDQKAVLKVGTDEFFVTNVTSTTTTGTATTTTPSVTLQPFFSGIALDVTPSIDDHDNIILHVHPSVSVVSTVTKTVSVGGTAGTLSLPLASSSVSETDSIVRAHDGQIVAIGGLMRQASTNDSSGLPGLPKTLFGQTNVSTQKRELVILLKATVVDSNKDWSRDIAHSRDRIDELTR